MIYDCFTYFNEEEILDIRINELSELEVVHVLVESNHTFVGNERKIKKHDYHNVFQEIVMDMPNNKNPWDNEKHQRNCIMRALKKLNPRPEDTILISDVDEIPKAESVKQFDCDTIGAFLMDMYWGYLNLLQGRQVWNHARAIKWENMLNTTPQEVRLSTSIEEIKNAGWHFGWMGSSEKQIEKFKNFSHQEEAIQKHANAETLNRKKEIGQQIWTEDMLEFVDVDNLPKYVQLNKERFKHLIKEK